MLRSQGLRNGAYAPGVYYEEAFEAGAPSPFSTGVPVFIGCAATGGELEEHAPFHASRWEDFDARAHRFMAHGYLAPAVRGFFENGGQRCAIVSVPAASDLAGVLTTPFTPGGALEDLEGVDLVCVPDAMLADDEAVYRIQQAALEHCARTNRVAILDSTSPARSEEQAGDADASLMRVHEQRDRLSRAREGALYFPWVRVATRTGSNVTPAPRRGRASGGGNAASRDGALRLVPPCGHVAGVYSRVDTTQGARKAPANEILEGVADVEFTVKQEQHLELNELGVNCLRSFTGRGIRVYGARTLSGQPNWRFVNITRLFLTLARWMTYSLNDTVFEPHTPALWGSVRDRLSWYCLALYEQGALQGEAPEQAFFVKCDAETNPPDARDNGMIVAEVGLAPVVPAEFIVVRVTQRASGATFTPSTGL